MMDLERALEDAEAALAKEQNVLTNARRRVEALEYEVRGLRLALNRHGAGEQQRFPMGVGMTVDAPSFFRAVRQLLRDPDALLGDVNPGDSRTDTISAILQHARRPLSPTDIGTVLELFGDPAPPQVISASLSQLQKTDRARRVTRGRWIHPDRIDLWEREKAISQEVPIVLQAGEPLKLTPSAKPRPGWSPSVRPAYEKDEDP